MSIHYGADLALASAVTPEGRGPLSLVRSVLRYVWIPAITTPVCLVLGLVYLAQRPPRYLAETRLVVENIRLDASRQELLPTAAFVDPLIVDSQVEILKSPSLARKTSDTLGSAKAVELVGEGGGRPELAERIRTLLPTSLVAALPRPPPMPHASPTANLARVIETELVVRRLGQSTVIAVSFTGNDADASSTIVNTLVQHYLDDQAASAALSSGAVSAWLRDRVKDFGLKARVVSWATQPTQRSGPRALVILAAFAAVGGILGAIAALGCSTLDTRLYDPRAGSAAVGSDFFGALPKFGRRRSRALRRDSTDNRDRRVLLLTAATDHPRSPIAHLVRRVRGAILRRRPGCQVVGVTAATSGEGVTMLAANLASAAAAGGQRVLLVDANLYNPNLSAALAPDATLGLVDVLAGRAAVHEAVHRAPGFAPDVLACGDSPHASNAFERMAQTGTLTRALSHRYDLIVFDLPPMHPVADPAFASLYVDVVVVVVAWGAVSEAAMKRCLGAAGLADKVIGFVFNKMGDRAYRNLARSRRGASLRAARRCYVEVGKDRWFQ